MDWPKPDVGQIAVGDQVVAAVKDALPYIAHQRWEIALAVIRDTFEKIGWSEDVARLVASTTVMGMWQSMKHGYKMACVAPPSTSEEHP